MYSPIRNCRERFKASMTTSDAETRISRFFLLSEYDMTSDREANKHEKVLSEYDWATRQRTNKRERFNKRI